VVIPLHDANPTRRRAYVTLLIIALNVVVYVALQPHGGGRKEFEFPYHYAAIPCEITQGEPLNIIELDTQTCRAESKGAPEFFPKKNVWLAVLFSMFLHGSLLHIGGNMLFLWVFGNNVEDYLGKIGFIVFYLFAGAVAALAHIVYDPSSLTPVIGASGAIAGVMGMYLVLWPRARIIALVPFLAFIPLPIPAGIILVVWFGMQLLIHESGVAWVAHVGGFAAGALIGLLLKKVKSPSAAHQPD
jgi:membrane associated rhomboid family serine protease